jgi:hypothetical protein
MQIAIWVGVSLAVIILVKVGIFYFVRRALSESESEES